MIVARTKGFTLIELMVTISIMAILAAIAFPSFQGTMRSNQVATTSNELLASVALARSEAIRARGGGMCTSLDGKACGGDWNSGWLIWTDSNGNKAVDVGEPIVRYVQAKSKLVMDGSATTIAFDSRGRARDGKQTIALHPQGVTTPARCVYISATGQTRIAEGVCI